jgi:hypothetical protein
MFVVIACNARDARAQTTEPLMLSVPAPASADADDQTPRAQDPLPEPEKPTRGFASALVHNMIDDVKHIPRRNSAYWLVGGTAAALSVHPFDQELNRHLVGSGEIGDAFIPGKYIGATETQIAASITTYIVGRARHQPRVQHIGMDLLEAQILTEGVVEAIKIAVRRERPLNPDGTHYSGYSFPSGHAAVTFASATVLQQHLGWKAAVPTYALATYVAASRLHDNRHFVSDVVFGATTGIIIGRSVTWHGRNTYTLAVVPMAGGLGGSVIW